MAKEKRMSAYEAYTTALVKLGVWLMPSVLSALVTSWVVWKVIPARRPETKALEE